MGSFKNSPIEVAKIKDTAPKIGRIFAKQEIANEKCFNDIDAIKKAIENAHGSVDESVSKIEMTHLVSNTYQIVAHGSDSMPTVIDTIFLNQNTKISIKCLLDFLILHETATDSNTSRTRPFQ